MVKPSKNAHSLSDLLKKVDEMEPENEVSAQVNSSFCLKNKTAEFANPSGGASDSQERTITNGNDAFHLNRGWCRYERGAAFTLVEVLVTLGIIGIVAAMTLPSVINDARNKKLEAGFKKSYSVISQAFEMYYAENGERATCRAFKGTTFKDKIMPYFQVLKDCGSGRFYTNGECVPIGTDPYKRYDGTFGFTIFASYYEEGSFILSDGSFIRIYHLLWGAGDCLLAVDVNGFRKKPNRAGYDLFVFELDDKGKILPEGEAESKYPYNSSLWDGHVANRCSSRYNNNGENGVSCAYRALTENNYFKNLH